MKIKNLDAYMLRRVAQQLEMAANFKDMQGWAGIDPARKQDLAELSRTFTEQAAQALVEAEP